MVTNSNNPIEYLIAFGVTFLAGALSVVAIQQYGKFIKRQNQTS